jgi:hypothetical protein
VTGWTRIELDTVAEQDELTVASRRCDGTLNRTRIVWAARVGDEVFVRSVNGPDAAWYRSAQVRHAGHISCGHVATDVIFDDVSDDTTLNADIDSTYRAKYRRYARSIVDSVCSAQARSTTLRLSATDAVAVATN